ncbi:Uncharacterized protein APZ42_032801 [Daphnia magna]|uniref:Uncharacterized protein n=1 Tax=Daphnia magna TaxID=35525 RepID=A0A164LV45_9CRUS|nr:Uncharacterized protein APZ42_032801 [Daphnia magna]
MAHSVAGRRRWHSQIGGQLLQVWIAGHHRNALLRPQMQTQQLRLSGCVTASRTRQRPLLRLDRLARDGRRRRRRQQESLAGRAVVAPHRRRMALQDVSEAELTRGEFAAADGTSVTTSTTSSCPSFRVPLLLIADGHIVVLFVGLRGGSSRRRRWHQGVQEVEGELMRHQVSLELFQRQLMAAQRALNLLLVGSLGRPSSPHSAGWPRMGRAGRWNETRHWRTRVRLPTVRPFVRKQVARQRSGAEIAIIRVLQRRWRSRFW